MSTSNILSAQSEIETFSSKAYFKSTIINIPQFMKIEFERFLISGAHLKGYVHSTAFSLNKHQLLVRYRSMNIKLGRSQFPRSSVLSRVICFRSVGGKYHFQDDHVERVERIRRIERRIQMRFAHFH